MVTDHKLRLYKILNSSKKGDFVFSLFRAFVVINNNIFGMTMTKTEVNEDLTHTVTIARQIK